MISITKISVTHLLFNIAAYLATGMDTTYSSFKRLPTTGKAPLSSNQPIIHNSGEHYNPKPRQPVHCWHPCTSLWWHCHRILAPKTVECVWCPDIHSSEFGLCPCGRLFSVCGMLTVGRRNRIEKSLNIRAWLKVNHDVLADIGMWSAKLNTVSVLYRYVDMLSAVITVFTAVRFVKVYEILTVCWHFCNKKTN